MKEPSLLTPYAQASLDRLGDFEALAEQSCRLAKSLPAVWQPDLLDADPREIHNRYVKCLLASYASRYSEYLSILVVSTRARNYLGYSMAGRALIEIAAVLRYYLKHHYEPALMKPTMSGADMRKLLTEDDRHLRGGRFDWFSYLTRPLLDVVKAYEGHFNEKNPKKRKPAGADALTQWSVMTCIEHWGKGTPIVPVLYACFCDMVHPNMGSHFMVASVSDEGMHFAKGRGCDTGVSIVDQTIQPLAAVIREFGKFYKQLLLSQWSEAEIAESSDRTDQVPPS